MLRKKGSHGTRNEMVKYEQNQVPIRFEEKAKKICVCVSFIHILSRFKREILVVFEKILSKPKIHG